MKHLSATRHLPLTIAIAVGLSACGATAETQTSSSTSASSGASVVAEHTITDNRGEVTIPADPKSIVVTDNRLFETLYDWGITLSAAPVALMHAEAGYASDDSIVDLGSHREPNLEAIVAVQPDVVINGQRFAQYYEDVRALVPDAALVDIDVRDDQPLADELRRQTTLAGEIFGKEDEAAALVEAFDASIARVVAAYDPTETVMGVITTGGNMNYAAPVTGRTLGPVFETLGLSPALETEGSTDHEGDDISVEAVASSNPDWILVMDRDAGVSSQDGDTYVPANDLIASSQALQNVTAVTQQQIVYMPPDTYVNEGIQTYTEFFNSMADAMENQN